MRKISIITLAALFRSGERSAPSWIPVRSIIIGATFALTEVAAAQSSLPNPELTPGATDPRVTQANIQQTICVPGWSRDVRPPSRYTSALKRRQIRQYHYTDHHLSPYEEDHLIPLSLGGSPQGPRNLWPEPWFPPDGWTAEMKDELEAVLPRLVCAGQVPLAEAQRVIASDWHAGYRRWVHPVP